MAPVDRHADNQRDAHSQPRRFAAYFNTCASRVA
jgi:hypothetical protein